MKDEDDNYDAGYYFLAGTGPTLWKEMLVGAIGWLIAASVLCLAAWLSIGPPPAGWPFT